MTIIKLNLNDKSYFTTSEYIEDQVLFGVTLAFGVCWFGIVLNTVRRLKMIIESYHSHVSYIILLIMHMIAVRLISDTVPKVFW